MFISDDREHGWYKDHVSGEHGSLYDLAERLDVAITRLEASQTMRVFTGLKDYAEAHGVEDKVFAAWNWSVVAKDGRPALRFETAQGERWRFLDAEKPKYKSHHGFKACWYGLRKAAPLARQKALPLVICNGEASVVVAQHYGIPACCVSGGEGALPNLLPGLKPYWDGEIIVALDCDATGRRVADEVAERLPDAKIADLGLTRKGDLADFCRLHTETAMSELLKRAFVIDPNPPTPVIEVNYISMKEALQRHVAEVLEESPVAVKPIRNPFSFLHEQRGYGYILLPGKVMYIATYSGGGKTIMCEHGITRCEERGLHNILYSPEWADKQSQGQELAARAIQRAGGPDYIEQMEHKLYLAEKVGKIPGNAKELTGNQVSALVAKAGQLQAHPGETFVITDPGLSIEKLCRSVEAICEREAENGHTPTTAWLDFAQLLWIEHAGKSGRLWIEQAINEFKDVCRAKNLVGFVTSQMRKAEAEEAKANGHLTADMMQWLSEQQANLVLMMAAMKDENGQMARDGYGNPMLRCKIVKDSMKGPGDYFHVSWRPERLAILDGVTPTPKMSPQEPPRTAKKQPAAHYTDKESAQPAEKVKEALI